MSGLDTALTPLRFLERAIEVHPDRLAVVDGDVRMDYRRFGAFVTRMAHALLALGVRPGDRVMYLGANSAEMLAAHYAVPLSGGVLVAINTRLSPAEVTTIAAHATPTVVLGDATLIAALGDDPRRVLGARHVVMRMADGALPDDPGAMGFAEFLGRGRDDALPWEVTDETAPISINYTSGTTGSPKGVVYTHRGAYLNSLGEAVHQGFDGASRYLWTLPMFHCNGWCTTWALTAVAGTHVCLPAVRGPEIWRLIDAERITHLAGAPAVLSTIAGADQAHPLDAPLTVVTAGAAPSPTVIAQIGALGARVVHVYGLTETYGPYAICEPQDDWSELEDEEVAARLSRQGVGMLTSDRLRVVRIDDEDELTDVAPDGVEMGEIVMRGNSVMAGYFRDEAATEQAFRGGWFHSGDLGVRHPDGYVQLLDRSKDIIISGGENISTIEVEQVLLRHAAIADAAVVAVADDTWGERPAAFVVVTAGANADHAELVAHVRAHLASYKCPASFTVIEELPRTSTGKVRKDVLREAARAATPA